MSNMAKSKEQLQEQYSKLNEQYNNLLQKNQNDLIKIKQKQKSFNEAIQTLKQQKQQNEKKYKNDINVLMLELEKMKNGVSSAQPKKEEEKGSKGAEDKGEIVGDLRSQLDGSRKENQKMREIVELNKQRIQHLEENARKLIDQNIHLTSSCEQAKKEQLALKTKLEKLNAQHEKLLQRVSQMQSQQKSKNVKGQSQSAQTEGDYVVSYKEHNALIEKFNNQIRQLNKEIESKEEQNENIRTRLKQTNEQLKRYMDRDRKNNVLLKKKSEQLENLHIEMQNAKKSHKTERKRLTTEDTCSKCKQWQQQNKLLKQMVKSMQTMVRVREMQAERYKNRQTLNNSKIHQKAEIGTQPKKSRGQLPPLNKRA